MEILLSRVINYEKQRLVQKLSLSYKTAIISNINLKSDTVRQFALRTWKQMQTDMVERFPFYHFLTKTLT